MSDEMLEKYADIVKTMGNDFRELFIKTFKSKEEHNDMVFELCNNFISNLKRSEILKGKHFTIYDNNFYVGVFDKFGIILQAVDKDVSSNLKSLVYLWDHATGIDSINFGYQHNREEIDQYHNNCYVNIGNITLFNCGRIHCQTQDDARKCAQMFGFIINENPNLQNK